MIRRFSGRPGRAPADNAPSADEAADVFRRFFVALERLDPSILKAMAEAAGGAPETKAASGRRKARPRAVRARVESARAGRAAE